MIKYFIITLVSLGIGYAIAEVPYYLANNPAPAKRVEVSYNDKVLEMGRQMLGYLHRDEYRETKG